jgi:hypothetical protein
LYLLKWAPAHKGNWYLCLCWVKKMNDGLCCKMFGGKIEPETHLCISKPAKWFISVLWH